MRQVSKKQVNGKPVAIFSTDGANIADIVKMMEQDGWTFSKIVVSYPNKSGGTSAKEVQANQVASIVSKWNFDDWRFSATRQSQKLSGKVINSKHAAMISEAKNGALKAFENLGNAPALQPQRQHAAAPMAQQPTQYAPDSNRFQPKPADNRTAAAAALYDDEDYNQIPAVSDAQREMQRGSERAQKNAKVAEATSSKGSKHTLMIVLAILEFFGIASFPFGLVALIETVGGRKRLMTDPNEATSKIKFAKKLLIIGAVFAVVFWAIIAINLGPVVISLLT